MNDSNELTPQQRLEAARTTEAIARLEAEIARASEERRRDLLVEHETMLDQRVAVA